MGEKFNSIPGTNPDWGRELPEGMDNSLVDRNGNNYDNGYNFDEFDNDDEDEDKDKTIREMKKEGSITEEAGDADKLPPKVEN